ncbi:MAG: septum formation protein Maf [Neisseriaceae bacterium]|nr:septum formation protein Maf [Neisseriaceae bacterium]
MYPLILASTSIFRQQQLSKLGITFQAAAPQYDETPQIGESAEQTALRLAIGKAQSLSKDYPQHLIIGADQVAFCDGQQLGKPMNLANAETMLKTLSGKRIRFYSAVCLLNTFSGSLKTHVDETVVHMRVLNDAQIQRYLAREPDAIYCAGAAKSEGLGALLLNRIESTDPNALIGLPIFWLISALMEEGFQVI